MAQEFHFKLSAPDQSLLPQIRQVLETRTELESRARCPGMWKLTDQLNSSRADKAQPTPRRKLFPSGLLNLVLGFLLMLPGLMDPKDLWFALITGACGWLTGLILLWRNSRKLLTHISLITGAFLTLGGVLDLDELGRFLIPGIFSLAVAVLSVVVRVRPRQDPFQTAAEELLEHRRAVSASEVIFTDTGLLLPDQSQTPYSDFEAVFETHDLLVPIFRGHILLLQKQELTSGRYDLLRNLLADRTTVHIL